MSTDNELTPCVEMTASCARDLTDRIKEAGKEFVMLLYRAHEGKAWKALGYSSWKEYCNVEFQISKPRAYQLIDFVEIKREIEESTIVDPPQNESQTRALKSVPPEKRAQVWEIATEKANGGQPTGRQVYESVVQTSQKLPVKVPFVSVTEPEPELKTPHFFHVSPQSCEEYVSEELDRVYSRAVTMVRHQQLDEKEVLSFVDNWLGVKRLQNSTESQKNDEQEEE